MGSIAAEGWVNLESCHSRNLGEKINGTILQEHTCKLGDGGGWRVVLTRYGTVWS